jgi:hypothetical protein
MLKITLSACEKCGVYAKLITVCSDPYKTQQKYKWLCFNCVKKEMDQTDKDDY